MNKTPKSLSEKLETFSFGLLIATIIGFPLGMGTLLNYARNQEYKSFYELVEKAKELKMDSCSKKLLEVSHHLNPENKLFYKKSDSLRFELERKYDSCKECIQTIDSITYEEDRKRKLEQYLNRPFGGQVGY